MCHRFAIVIIAIIYIIISSIEFSYGCDSEVAKEIGLDNYNRQCPYGDAVYINKEEQELLGKLIPVGTPTDCVVLTENGLWEIRDWDFVEHRWNINRLNPKYYDIYTMDGKLVPTARGDVLIEETTNKF